MTHMLTTAYQLPFVVSYPSGPFFSTGQAASVTVRLREGSNDGIATRVADVFTRFGGLANAGALAGRHIEPPRSGLAARPLINTSPGVLVFAFERCLIDDASLIALCMMLLHKDVAPHIASIDVQAAQAGGAGQKGLSLTANSTGVSTFPERFGPLPFTLIDEQPESGAYTFTLELEAPLDDSARAALAAVLAAWTASVLGGAFALAPIPPEQAYLEPDDPFVEFDSSVEWTVFKLRADAAALDAFINIIAAFHGRQQRVRTLTVS